MALNDADIDQSMADDWAAILERHKVDEPEPPPATASETPPEVEAEPETPAAPERARDESGKFVKAPKEAKNEPSDKAPAASPAVDSGGSTASEKTDQNPQPAVGVRDTNKAPSSWKPLARAEFDKLSPTIKAEIHRRESDFQNGQAQLLPDAQLGKGMRQVIEPYRMLIEAEGGTPERAVADLLRTAATFRVGTPQQKAQALVGIARQYGVDLNVLSPAQPGQQPTQQGQEFRDPRVDQLLANHQRETVERQRREQQDLETTVTRWMSEQDGQGNPTRPYINDVIQDMSALIPAIKEANPVLTNAQALEEAYNRAIWAHPEIRTLLQQKAAADLEASRQAENQTRVRDAKRAASVNVPRRASIPSPAKPGSLEETIAATARELGLIT